MPEDRISEDRSAREPAPAAAARAALWPALLPVLAGVAVLLATILILSDGWFTYTLDDPYIHLALSRHLLHLHHGLGPGELASPSSSILYPWLLAPGALLPALHPYLPLAINTVCLGLGVGVLVRLFERGGLPAPAALAVTAAFALNGVGLVFSGLEHSAHVLVSLGVLAGLIRFLEEERLSWTLAAAIVAGPLLRFEGLGVSGAALLVLAAVAGRRRHRRALGLIMGLAAATAAPLALYAWTMTALGLPVLPSSVLLKSEVAAHSVHAFSLSGLIWRLLANVERSLLFTAGWTLWGLEFAAALKLLLPQSLADRTPADAALAWFLVLTGAAHLAAGAYGWFGRYEIYVLTLETAGGLYLWRCRLAWLAARLPRPCRWAPLCPAVVVLGLPYLRLTLDVPQAAANIHHQQRQMARFAAEFWPQPVAVNDLGLVAYSARAPVVDLIGLGSEEVRLARLSGRFGPEFLSELARRRGVTLVMAYPHLLRGWRVAEWAPVARLWLRESRITPAEETVLFLATPLTDRARLREALLRFGATLPPRAGWEVVGEATGPGPVRLFNLRP